MSSPNVELDFQDYTLDTSGAGATSQPQPDVQIKIPAPSNDVKKGATKTVLDVLQNVTSKGSLSSSEVSSEFLQQMLSSAMMEKQRNKQQRSNIAATGSWGLGYFAQYFDVTTDDVLQRIIWSAIPLRKTGVDIDDLDNSELILPLTNNAATRSGSSADDNISINPLNEQLIDRLGSKQKRLSYIERFIQSRPDFYGPFWVATTLVFAIAIISNIVSFRAHISRELKSLNSDGNEPELHWHYSMDELNTATSLILFHITLLPTFLWFLFWFRGCTKYYTITEIVCAFGYSLAVFIPTSVLLIIQALVFRYLVIILAAILSGLVLVMSFYPVAKSDPNPAGSHTILVIIGACQLGLAYIIHRILLQ